MKIVLLVPVLVALVVACGASSNAPPAPRPPPLAISTIDCSATDQAAVYCAHVKNRCCGEYQTWVCDDAIYVDWFAEQCRK